MRAVPSRDKGRAAVLYQPGAPLVLMLALLTSLAVSSCGYARRLLPVRWSEGFGYIDRRGQVAIRPAFAEASPFSEGRAAFSDGSAWGYIDGSGKAVVPPVFEWAGRFSEGLAPVRAGGRYGYMGLSGDLMVEPRYELADEFREGRAVVRRDGRYGYLDAWGEEAVEPRWLWAGRFSEGLALVVGESDCGYIDSDGAMRLRLPPPSSLPRAEGGNGPPQETAVQQEPPDIEEWQSRLDYHLFSEGLAPFERDGKTGYLDREGREVIEPRFQAGEPFSEGLAAVKRDGRWGYIDREGREVIEPAWQMAGNFSEGLAPVMDRGIWGYIDRGGSVVIRPSFDSAGIFDRGLAAVAIGDAWGYIDRRGGYLWVPTGPLTPFRVSSPPRLPLYLMDAALLACLALLVWGLFHHLLLCRRLRAGEEGQVLDDFMRSYHGSRIMRRIRRGPFALSDHLERLERNGALFLWLTAAFLALLWVPNLAFLALTGRGMINHLFFHRNAFPGDDPLYLSLGSLALLALAAYLLAQRRLVSALLRRLREPPPDDGQPADPAG